VALLSDIEGSKSRKFWERELKEVINSIVFSHRTAMHKFLEGLCADSNSEGMIGGINLDEDIASGAADRGFHALCFTKGPAPS
jgi:hypothetical protein